MTLSNFHTKQLVRVSPYIRDGRVLGSGVNLNLFDPATQGIISLSRFEVQDSNVLIVLEWSVLVSFLRVDSSLPVRSLSVEFWSSFRRGLLCTDATLKWDLNGLLWNVA
jgi:hypothetical protein